MVMAMMPLLTCVVLFSSGIAETPSPGQMCDGNGNDDDICNPVSQEKQSTDAVRDDASLLTIGTKLRYRAGKNTASKESEHIQQASDAGDALPCPAFFRDEDAAVMKTNYDAKTVLIGYCLERNPGYEEGCKEVAEHTFDNLNNGDTFNPDESLCGELDSLLQAQNYLDARLHGQPLLRQQQRHGAVRMAVHKAFGNVGKDSHLDNAYKFEKSMTGKFTINIGPITLPSPTPAPAPTCDMVSEDGHCIESCWGSCGISMKENGKQICHCDCADIPGCVIHLQDLGGSGCSSSSKCQECQGDCDSDNDCSAGLYCFQRDSSSESVPGCESGGSGDVGTHDYCAHSCQDTCPFQKTHDCVALANQHGHPQTVCSPLLAALAGCSWPAYVACNPTPPSSTSGALVCEDVEEVPNVGMQRLQLAALAGDAGCTCFNTNYTCVTPAALLSVAMEEHSKNTGAATSTFEEGLVRKSGDC